MKSLIAVGLSFVLTSCMHLGMMGTHDNNQSPEHQAASEPILEKEVIVNNIVGSAVFPPLVLRKEVMFELRLKENDNGRPISGATVFFHAAYLHKAEGPGGDDAHMVHGESDSAHARPRIDHAISFEQEIQESSQPGLYSVAFTPLQSGEHTLMFHVSGIANETLEQELVIEATRNVVSGNTNHAGMMDGMGSTSGYLIMGGAIMGVAMIVMWVTRGSMF